MLLASRLTGKRIPVHIQVVRREEFKAIVPELYNFSNSVMEEDYDHWLTHAYTNEEVHLFRDDKGLFFRLLVYNTEELLGFQFWSTAQGSNPKEKTILGGKLRTSPILRGTGVHLMYVTG